MNFFAALARQFAAHPLTRDRQLGAWLRFLIWQLRGRLAQEAIVSWVGNQRLAVRRGMTGATGNLYFGLHEFMSMGLVLHFLREGDLFLDAGANVGTYTVLASGICRAKSIAIEADGDTGRDLQRNIELNGLQDLVRVHLVALGPADGAVHFTIGHGATNRVVAAAGPGVRSVPQKTLDHIVGEDLPAMIKLDVEDYEDPVMRGAVGVLKKPSLKVITLETATPWMLEMFAEHGFERAFYDPFTRKLERTPNELAFSNGQWTLSNDFFVRDWEFVSHRVATAPPVAVLGRRL